MNQEPAAWRRSCSRISGSFVAVSSGSKVRCVKLRGFTGPPVRVQNTKSPGALNLDALRCALKA